MLDDENDAVIVRSTIGLAHNLGLCIVAESVENQDMLDVLTILGCGYAQGYHISRPVPGKESNAWRESAKSYRLTRTPPAPSAEKFKPQKKTPRLSGV